jgi:hypothetical protein
MALYHPNITRYVPHVIMAPQHNTMFLFIYLLLIIKHKKIENKKHERKNPKIPNLKSYLEIHLFLS